MIKFSPNGKAQKAVMAGGVVLAIGLLVAFPNVYFGIRDKVSGGQG